MQNDYPLARISWFTIPHVYLLLQLSRSQPHDEGLLRSRNHVSSTCIPQLFQEHRTACEICPRQAEYSIEGALDQQLMVLIFGTRAILRHDVRSGVVMKENGQAEFTAGLFHLFQRRAQSRQVLLEGRVQGQRDICR